VVCCGEYRDFFGVGGMVGEFGVEEYSLLAV